MNEWDEDSIFIIMNTDIKKMVPKTKSGISWREKLVKLVCLVEGFVFNPSVSVFSDLNQPKSITHSSMLIVLE